MSQAVGLFVPLAVSKLLLAADQRSPIGRARRLRFKELLQTAILRIRRRSLIPVHQQLLALRGDALGSLLKFYRVQVIIGLLLVAVIAARFVVILL